MTKAVDTTRALVVCDRDDPRARAVERKLAERGLAADWYAPRNIDDVDAAVAAGEVSVVVLPAPSDVLPAIWDEQVHLERWRSAGVEIVFCEGDNLATADMLERLAADWRKWQALQRRRRGIAGIILGLLAMLVAFSLISLSR